MSHAPASPKTTFRRYDDVLRDELLSPKGSPEREAYEFELSLDPRSIHQISDSVDA